MVEGNNNMYKTSPEYWSGHSGGDDCDWRKPELPAEQKKLGWRTRRAADKKITAFLEGEKPEDLSVFVEGRVFDASDYDKGTIIGIEKERIHYQNNSSSYTRSEYVGIVEKVQNEKKEETVIISYIPFKSSDLLITRNVIEPVIDVGAVTHTRIDNDPFKHDFAEKVHKVTVYEMGKQDRNNDTGAKSPTLRATLQVLQQRGRLAFDM